MNPTVPPPDQLDQPPSSTEALRSVHTSNLPDLFRQLKISLVVSTYQAGKVILVRADGATLNTHFRAFGKPMGIAADRSRLTIGGTNTVWYYRNVPAVAPKLEPQGRHDACYLPRRIHVTGDIDIHELAYDRDDALWVVNTRFGYAVTGTCPPPATDQRGVVSRPQPAGGNCDIGSFEVMVPPDLAVAKSDSADPVAFGDQLTYTVTVNNAGAGDATGVMLTDTLPSSVDFVSVSPSGSCGESGGEVTCDLGDLASGDDATVTIVVQPTATGTVTNSVAVTSVETDDNPRNNTDSETTNVIAVARALRCNGLVPTIVGTPGDDTNLRGTNGPDVIHGLGGNDTISGLNGNDVICGGEGNDTLSGNNGIDRLFGENGNDTLNGNNGNDALDGGAGSTDTCNGGNGSDTGTACESVTSIP